MGSLSSMVTTLVKKFLPEHYIRYVQYNIKSIHKKYTSEVPRFLHCKPKVFVDHCLGRLPTPGHPTSISAEVVGPRKFKVTSYDSDSVYTVDLGQALPCCSCKDWLNTHWPLKHMLHVMINIPGNSWHTLSEDFINSPHLCCDSDMLVEGQVHDHASGDSPASAFANVSAKRKATLSMCSGGIINKKPVAIASTCKTLAASIRNMMFLVRDAADYEDIYVDLLLVHRNLASRIPAQSGLFLRPTIRGRRPSVLLNGSLKMRKKQSWKRKQVLKTAARVKHHVSSSLKVIPQDSVLTMSFNKTDADDLLKSGQQLMPGVGQQAKIPCDDCGRSYHFTNYCVEADFERLGDGERFRCTLCRMNYWPRVLRQQQRATNTNQSNFQDYESVSRGPKKPVGPKLLAEKTPTCCLCTEPHDERQYWECDKCGSRLHPGCIGRDPDETPADSSTAFWCEACLTAVVKVWPVDNCKEFIESGGLSDDEGYIIDRVLFCH